MLYHRPQLDQSKCTLSVTTNHHLPPTNHQPPSNNPPTTNHHPTTNNQQPTTNNQVRALLSQLQKERLVLDKLRDMVDFSEQGERWLLTKCTKQTQSVQNVDTGLNEHARTVVYHRATGAFPLPLAFAHRRSPPLTAQPTSPSVHDRVALERPHSRGS